MSQTYTSANTSVNKGKLPRIYGLVYLDPEQSVIDYGCGKYFDSYQLGDNIVGYDPYNRNNPELLNRNYDIALCSNVLNVIMEREERIKILETLRDLANTTFITVYEGDKSRHGRVTKKDCYQLNWLRSDYIPELVEVFGFGNVKYNRKGYFECWSEVA